MTGESGDRDTSTRPLPRRAALDGLRAAAIAAVMLFHFPTRRWVAGGLFGVDLFFALSGFLVTAILLAELTGDRAPRIRVFLARRGWRLLPALTVFLVVYLAADAAFGQSSWFASNPFGSPRGHPVPFHEAAREVAGAASYSLNVLRIHRVAMPDLSHLWSLSIEGQFYVLWPIVIVVVGRWRRRLLLPLTLVAAVASAGLPFLVWHGGAGATEIYFGSATRMQGLLIGSIGAQMWAARWPSRLGLTSGPGLQARRAVVGVAFGVLVWMIVTVGNVTFKYLGAVTVASVCGVILVVHFCEDGPPGYLARLLASRPLVWLGQRSYAIYLWHYLIACWTNPLPHAVGVPLGMACALVVAEASWRLVEQPAQRWAAARRRVVQAKSATASRSPVRTGAGA